MNPTREEFIARATNLKVVPTLNGIVEKVFDVLSDAYSSPATLGEVVQYDQAISSKVISIANSAYYSRGVEIFSLQRAVLTIGFNEIREIVTSLIFMENILKMLKLKEEDLFALWKHSMLVACAARTLSERLFIDDPSKVYTLSLLHDIGKIVFYLSCDEYGNLARRAHTEKIDDSVLEKDTFGIDHQELGRVIAIKWKFPEDFACVISHHHENGNGRCNEYPYRIINEANKFAHDVHDRQSAEGIILEKERDSINEEVEKVMEYLHLG